jgi:hypothetical protein
MKKTEEMLQDVEKNGMFAKGRAELIKHLNGERLNPRQMVIAKCYDCMGFYSDGRGTDCEMPDCSLYPLMPYRKQGEKYVSKKMPPMSEEHKQKLQAGRRAKNQK